MRACQFVPIAVLACSAVFFARPSIAQTPELEIRVVPRIGLFNALQYQADGNSTRPAGLYAAETNWTPFKKSDYILAVQDRNSVLSAQLPSGAWDLLTTDPDRGGYRTRRVEIAFSPREPASNCVLAFKDPRGAVVPVSGTGVAAADTYASADCKFDPQLAVASNEKLAAVLQFESGGARRQVPADIPEDFLIVSLGDSYAAGEGNPDAQCKRWFFKLCDTRARWMDERCHRSALASTIRAGLQILRDEKILGINHRGAVTIASLACSGATLTNGVLGRSNGTIDLTKFRKNNADRGLVAIGSKLEEDDELPDQLTALRIFLDGQDLRHSKRAVDVLTVTVGGNDIGFGPALTDMVLRGQRGRTLDQVEATLRDRLRSLNDEELPKLRDRFAQLHAAGRYQIRQTMITEYPDPTRISSGPDKFCANVPADGLLGSAAGFLGYRLSEEESALAYRVVVRGLNGIVATRSGEYAWRPVDGLMDDKELIGRGWCADGSSNAYEPQARWFRKVGDSFEFQGDAYGSMHPTWQMHEKIAERMVRWIAAGVGQPLRASIGNTRVQSGEALVIRPPLVFAISDPKGPAAARLVCYGSPETCNSTGEFGLRADVDPGTVRVLHGDSARWTSEPVAALIPDGEPPYLAACRIKKKSGDLDCRENTWMTEGDQLTAEFKDQGKADLAQISWFTVERDTQTVPLSAPTSVTGSLLIPERDISSGRHWLYLSAVDKVGNATKSIDELILPIRVDRLPPTFKKIAIHEHDFAGAAEPFVAPAFIGEEVRVDVTTTDSGSGVRSKWLIVAPETSRIRYDGDQGEAAGQCPPIGQLKIFGEWAKTPPFYVLIGKSTGGPGDKVGAELSALDCAFNSKKVALELLKIAPSTQPPQPAAWWQAPGRPLDQLGPKVTRMAGNKALPPPDNPASFGWSLVAGWLNIAAGMLNPAAPTPQRISFPSCGFEPVTGTAFSLLKTAQTCLEMTLAGEDEKAQETRIAFLSQLDSLLKQVYQP